jgi:hypothetical protein
VAEIVLQALIGSHEKFECLFAVARKLCKINSLRQINSC